MILFASAHDDPTRANHAIATQIRDAGDVFIERELATRESLFAALSASNMPLFAMSHGEVDQLMAQGGKEMPPALDVTSLPSLRGRSVFAYACLTGRELGKFASNLGNFWWGYQKVITAPSDEPVLLPIFTKVFRFAKASFHEARNAETQELLFRELQRECENARDRLDEISAEGHTIVPLGAYQCFIDLEMDLVVWCPGSDEPRRSRAGRVYF